MAVSRSLTWLARDLDLRASFGAACLAVAILSGKFGLGGEFLSIRFYATVAAAVLLFPQFRGLRPSGAAWILIVALGYLLLRSVFDPGPRTMQGQIDLAYMILQIVLITAAARAGLTSLVATTLAIAAAMLIAAIIGQFFPDIGSGNKAGLGWGPIGTVITFSRIEFLGFALALALVPYSRAAAVLAAIFLYATLASVMKAALVGTLLAMAAISALLLLNRKWREFTMVAGIAVVAFAGFQITHLDKLAGRVETAMSSGHATLDSAIECDANPKSCLGYLTATFEYCVRNPDGTPLCGESGFTDGSQRLILFLEAMQGVSAAPIFGHGVGHFAVLAITPGTSHAEAFGHPHNLVAEIAFAGGGVGLALMGLALAALFVSLVNSSATVFTRSVIAGFAVFMFTVSMFGGDIYDTRFLWLAAFAVIQRWPARAPASADGQAAA